MMLYDNFLEEIKKIKIPENIFNPLKFKVQFLQSIYLFEEYFKINFNNRKKAILSDLFGGFGIYALFFAKHYKELLSRIYVTEKDKMAYDLMVKIIKSNRLVKFIIPCKVETNALFNPFLCKNFDKANPDVLLANPPYIPIPFNLKFYLWGNGGPLGLSAVKEFLRDLPKFAPKSVLFGCLAYSIGHKKIEKGSIITSNFPIRLTNRVLEKERVEYDEVVDKICKDWNLKFFVLKPPAWVAYDKKADLNFVSLKKYYSLIFKKNKEIENFIKLFPPKFRYLSNIFIIGQKKRNHTSERIILKNIETTYLKSVMTLEKICWPLYLQASLDNIHSRLKYFPDGCVGAFNLKGKLIGFATSQRINFEPYSNILLINRPQKWMKLDSFRNSNILETCDPIGNALHLVSACVLPEYRKCGIWLDMIVFRLKLAKLLNLKYAVIVSRLNLNKNIGVQKLFEYVSNYEDPYLKFLMKIGFVVNGVIEKKDDISSGGYWVLMYKTLINGGDYGK